MTSRCPKRESLNTATELEKRRDSCARKPKYGEKGHRRKKGKRASGTPYTSSRSDTMHPYPCPSRRDNGRRYHVDPTNTILNASNICAASPSVLYICGGNGALLIELVGS